ncbi:MAG: protoporphyrinogen oxidase [bacterium]
MKTKEIVILGAGISGLATAYWLKKAGFSVEILEASSQPGGAMETVFEDGFLVDYGPNSGLETTPLIKQIVNEVGLSEQMIYANEEGNKRYILKNNNLYPLPMGLLPFLKTKLFSIKGKLRLFCEPFVGKSQDGYYQSIAQFVTRRLGPEFLKYAIDPFVSGVFAGDPEKLSVKSAFPKLYRLEELYGGLIKGMIRGARERKKRAEQSKQNAKMFSFKDGMQVFPKAIAEKLSLDISYNSIVNRIEKTNELYYIHYTKNGKEHVKSCNNLLSTIPAHKLSNIINILDLKLSKQLQNIIYPPVIVLYLGYNKADIGRDLDGFGFLIPSSEKKNFLGAIWSSTIFINRSESKNASFTIFIGGARHLDLLANDINKVINTAVKEFESMMNITAAPILKKYKVWEHAIPQYNIGYIENDRAVEKCEDTNKGFFISGNFCGGISVGDCIKNSELVAGKIIEYISK